MHRHFLSIATSAPIRATQRSITQLSENTSSPHMARAAILKFHSSSLASHTEKSSSSCNNCRISAKTRSSNPKYKSKSVLKTLNGKTAGRAWLSSKFRDFAGIQHFQARVTSPARGVSLERWILIWSGMWFAVSACRRATWDRCTTATTRTCWSVIRLLNAPISR